MLDIFLAFWLPSDIDTSVSYYREPEYEYYQFTAGRYMTDDFSVYIDGYKTLDWQDDFEYNVTFTYHY